MVTSLKIELEKATMTNPFNKFKEECGIFGIYNSQNAAINTALGLHALQHRGQEACGIISFDDKGFHIQHVEGLVGDNFSSEKMMKKLSGKIAIGHVRYSTSGHKNDNNVQPIFAECSFGGIAIAHNGNLTNTNNIKKDLISKGTIFKSSMDTEVILHLIARSSKNLVKDKIIDALSNVVGAYSLVLICEGKLIAVRDPNGVRPLSIGRLDGSCVIASETCAFDIIGAEFVRDVENGEMVIIDENGIESMKICEKKPSKFCIFEYVYFARPDSKVLDKNVYFVRKNIGQKLAEETKIEADIVVPVPDSGVPSAIGYSERSGIPFDLGIIRNHYVGRTFIEPTDRIRNFGVKLKHNANRDVINGKRVVLVDDSLVRGTTSRKIVKMIRDAGAKEVHMLIAAPPTIGRCFYGIDTPNKEELIANMYENIREINEEIGSDSLHYISLDGLYEAILNAKRNNSRPQYCDACFSGKYPIKLVDDFGGDVPLFEET